MLKVQNCFEFETNCEIRRADCVNVAGERTIN